MADKQRSGLMISGDLTEEKVSRLANAVARFEDGGNAKAEQEQIEREEEWYRFLTNGPSTGAGWHVWRDPLHRLEEKNRPTADIVRRQVKQYPLTMRLREYGEQSDGSPVQWVEARHPMHLTAEELLSDPRYIELREQAAARGECEPIEILLTADDQEPNALERYELAKAVAARYQAPIGTVSRATIQNLGYLIPALRNTGAPLMQALELAYKWPTDNLTMEQRIRAMAEVVPQLGRLVTWMEAREKAA